ncbi:tRNA-dihydrouridine(47) synthase [NAD(P)(+)]-like protein, partial [Kickxella alabastrina]
MTVPTIDSNSTPECPAPEPGCNTAAAGSTETQTEEAEQRPVKAGEAPIKKEFLAKVTPAAAAAAAAAAPVTEPCTEPSAAPAKATGGQNANRRAQNKNKAYQVSTSDRLCAKLSLGEDCPFGDKCTFSHDIAKYLTEKPVDLGTQCVLFDAYGACKYGLRCRYAGAHTDAEHKQMRVEGKQQLYAHNDFGREIQIRMRKKQITFPRTDAFDRTYAASGGGEPPIADQEPKRQKTARRVDFRGKTYLAPLTTVGNLPFRRICKGFGVDITCSEMALAGNLLQGQQSEWALLKRHPSEALFGIQLAGNRADQLGRAAEAVGNECLVDFIDLNMGCPIDMAYNSGGGSALMAQSAKVERIVRTMRA